jgi:hypothetical protein
MIGESGKIAALARAPEAFGDAAQEHRHHAVDCPLVDWAVRRLLMKFGPGFAAHGTPLHSWKQNVIAPS